MDNRASTSAQLGEPGAHFDVVIVGGGANGAGIALDAASRGLRVALLERSDFGSGTSSRSSKLIHGGVRYLGLGQWQLVREALAERRTLLTNAPGLVKAQRFLIPAYSYFELAKFRAGLKLYDWMAADRGVEASSWTTVDAASTLVPTLRDGGLRGAVAYDDAVFDDSRLLISILHKARQLGAQTLNYAEVVKVLHGGSGRCNGVVVHDHIEDTEIEVRGTVVVNATGAYGDSVRQLDDTAASATLSPSQGAHLIVDARFLGGNHAMVLPRTADGRIMFAVPWHGHVLLGTTDTRVDKVARDPRPLDQEIDAILEVAQQFLDPAPTRADVLSAFAGLRPLVGVPDGSASARRSREHALLRSDSGMITVSGGKWTTYRVIAAQAVDLAVEVGEFAAGTSTSHEIALAPHFENDDLHFEAWGAGAQDLRDLVCGDADLGTQLHPDLPYCGAHFVWAARAEFALSVSDALAYRTRAMFLNAHAAAEIAPRVADLMAKELGHDAAWIAQEISAARACAQSFAIRPLSP